MGVLLYTRLAIAPAVGTDHAKYFQSYNFVIPLDADDRLAA
jgi:hypothetical protein